LQAQTKSENPATIAARTAGPALARLPAIICFIVRIVVSLRAKSIERLSRG